MIVLMGFFFYKVSNYFLILFPFSNRIFHITTSVCFLRYSSRYFFFFLNLRPIWCIALKLSCHLLVSIVTELRGDLMCAVRFVDTNQRYPPSSSLSKCSEITEWHLRKPNKQHNKAIKQTRCTRSLARRVYVRGIFTIVP